MHRTEEGGVIGFGTVAAWSNSISPLQSLEIVQEGELPRMADIGCSCSTFLNASFLSASSAVGKGTKLLIMATTNAGKVATEINVETSSFIFWYSIPELVLSTG